MKNDGKNPSLSTLLRRAKNTVDKPLYSFNLSNCQAKVYHSEKYLVLKSYDTIVAIYDIESQTEYDFLKLVYGYSATSVRHISRFINKYIPACFPFACVKRIRIEKPTDI